jgi:hypothetical protein
MIREIAATVRVDHRRLAAAFRNTLRLEGLSVSQHPIDLERLQADAVVESKVSRRLEERLVLFRRFHGSICCG